MNGLAKTFSNLSAPLVKAQTSLCNECQTVSGPGSLLFFEPPWTEGGTLDRQLATAFNVPQANVLNRFQTHYQRLADLVIGLSNGFGLAKASETSKDDQTSFSPSEIAPGTAQSFLLLDGQAPTDILFDGATVATANAHTSSAIPKVATGFAVTVNVCAKTVSWLWVIFHFFVA